MERPLPRPYEVSETNVGAACDFCGAMFTGVAEVYTDRGPHYTFVRQRPPGKAAIFPWNVEWLPEGCDYHHENLKRHGVEVRTACPECMR